MERGVCGGAIGPKDSVSLLCVEGGKMKSLDTIALPQVRSRCFQKGLFWYSYSEEWFAQRRSSPLLLVVVVTLLTSFFSQNSGPCETSCVTDGQHILNLGLEESV